MSSSAVRAVRCRYPRTCTRRLPAGESHRSTRRDSCGSRARPCRSTPPRRRGSTTRWQTECRRRTAQPLRRSTQSSVGAGTTDVAAAVVVRGRREQSVRRPVPPPHPRRDLLRCRPRPRSCAAGRPAAGSTVTSPADVRPPNVRPVATARPYAPAHKAQQATAEIPNETRLQSLPTQRSARDDRDEYRRREA